MQVFVKRYSSKEREAHAPKLPPAKFIGTSQRGDVWRWKRACRSERHRGYGDKFCTSRLWRENPPPLPPSLFCSPGLVSPVWHLAESLFWTFRIQRNTYCWPAAPRWEPRRRRRRRMRRRPGGEDSVGGACGAGWAERRLTRSDPAAGQHRQTKSVPPDGIQHQSLGSTR